LKTNRIAALKSESIRLAERRVVGLLPTVVYLDVRRRPTEFSPWQDDVFNEALNDTLMPRGGMEAKMGRETRRSMRTHIAAHIGHL
jgi:hypothetical protein